MTIHLTDLPLYKLLKTGQTTQYGGYLDDGLYERGIAKAYTVLTLGVYSGHTHIILNALDEPHTNECVYDRRTQLMWSREACDHLGPAADGKLPWTTNVNGEGIFTYVAAANAALLAGYSDWRIPNDLELSSLRDMEQPNAVPDAVAFPGWPSSDWFWSSTTQPNGAVNAMVVYFNYGGVGSIGKAGSYFVALVRGG
jgi:hypothetical protein